jgi:hypothetical protein
VVNGKTFEGFVIEFRGTLGLYLNTSLLVSLIGETFKAVNHEEFRNNII